MRKFGILGHPLGHSLSPQIHERLFALDGEKTDYQMYDIPPEELHGKFGFLAELDGFNITIPHKVSIIDFCDRLDEGAQRYRSVNCVRNGAEKVGYNTDVIGFTKSIAALGASLSSNVLLIGCGGVGRMMAIETALSGGDLTIAALKSDKPLAEGSCVRSRLSSRTRGRVSPSSAANRLTATTCRRARGMTCW